MQVALRVRDRIDLPAGGELVTALAMPRWAVRLAAVRDAGRQCIYRVVGGATGYPAIETDMTARSS